MFYDQGVAAGIDPAYLAAFFVIESACGTRGVARTTHSLGNIRCTPGYACAAGYRAYPTWADGARDWFALIRSLYLDRWDLHTPAAILSRYAPPGDGNDPAAYATGVIQLVDGWTELRALMPERRRSLPRCPDASAPGPVRLPRSPQGEPVGLAICVRRAPGPSRPRCPVSPEVTNVTAAG